MQLPSKWMEQAVDQLATLPGVGRKTALRLALHLLQRGDDQVERFTRAIDRSNEGQHLQLPTLPQPVRRSTLRHLQQSQPDFWRCVRGGRHSRRIGHRVHP